MSVGTRLAIYKKSIKEAEPQRQGVRIRRNVLGNSGSTSNSLSGVARSEDAKTVVAVGGLAVPSRFDIAENLIVTSVFPYYINYVLDRRGR